MLNLVKLSLRFTVLCGLFLSLVNGSAVAAEAGVSCAPSEDVNSTEVGPADDAAGQFLQTLPAQCIIANTLVFNVGISSASDPLIIHLNSFNDGTPVFLNTFFIDYHSSITNVELDGTAYISNTQIAVATADDFSRVVTYTFGGNNLTFTVAKAAGTNILSGFTVSAVDNTAPTVAITGVPSVTDGATAFTATFTFSEAVTGFTLGDIGVTNGTASAINPAAGAGTVFTATITPVSTGAPTSTVSVDVAAGAAQDAAGNNNTAATTATTTFTDEALVRTRTKAIRGNFAATRGGQIIGGDPELASRLGSRGGGDDGIAGIGFTANGTLANNRLGFATSLRQMIGAAKKKKNKQKQREELQTMMGLGQQSLGRELDENGLDIWVQGTWAHINTETAKSDLGLFYLGVDYRFSPTLLVGMLMQYDWTDEKSTSDAFAIDGKGWMAGPYVVAKLGSNLTFDGRVAWGKSDNTISPFNTYEDSFDSTRWLARGTLTGNFAVGGVNVSPHVGVIHFEENLEAYTDSNGFAIASQTVSIGRLSFGPKISTTYRSESGTVISPHIGIKGLWDFNKAQQVDLVTGLAAGSSDDLRARIDGGVSVTLPGGISLAGAGFYDGIGANDLEAFGGSVRLSVPLN